MEAVETCTNACHVAPHDRARMPSLWLAASSSSVEGIAPVNGRWHWPQLRAFPGGRLEHDGMACDAAIAQLIRAWDWDCRIRPCGSLQTEFVLLGSYKIRSSECLRDSALSP